MRYQFTIISLLILFVSAAQAGDFKWSGTYRFEGLQVSNAELSDGNQSKAYMLHHLILKPEIVAYDGLTIRSRFDIMNNRLHPNSQLGQDLGSGVSNNTGAANDADSSNTLSEQLASDTLAITQLYATWVHEFGVLTIGRAPIHFGLGMRFNSGAGAFDHWFDTRDIVAYKFVFGNFYLMPVLAKINEGLLSQEDDVNDYIFQAQYENPETELALGFIWQSRRSTSNANSNDSPNSAVAGIVDPIFGGAGSTQFSNYEVDFYNFFVSQWVDSVKISFELGFADGNTGIRTAGGKEVDHNAFGAAIELDYKPKSSAWDLELDLGYASGDDPATEGTYEGYLFDRNYDVAFLLFNHPMGQRDFLRTSYTRNSSTGNAARDSGVASSYYDEETVSNTLYASLAFNYRWAEKYAFQPRFTYAQLNKDPILGANVDSDIGYELDLTLSYAPFEGFQWVNRVGAFFPGSTFKGGTNNLPAEFTYGIETKAAISF